jgi:hypothetical protein
MKRALLSILTPLALAFSAHAATEQWSSVVTSNTLTLNILEPTTSNTNALPLVIYLENLAAPRIGTESDDAIIADFRASGYLVAVLDYHHDPRARVPFLNRDLGKLRDDLRAKKLLRSYPLEDAHMYLVPSGSRLKRDVIYYPDPHRTLALDIIYPSKPAAPPAALIEFSCDNLYRFGNTSLSICSDTILDAEATEGFAVAMADHPVAPPYKGLDAMPDCAWKIKAAVRTLRAEGDALGLSGHIGTVGFSRGSGMALMLVTTRGLTNFENHGAHPEASSDVQAAVVLSGRFTYLDLLPDDHMIPRYNKAWGERTNNLATWRNAGAMDYLTHATIPLFLSINCSEAPDALYQMTVLRQRLAALGNAETFMMDPTPRGHKVPLDPDILQAMNLYLHTRLK